MIEPEPVDSQGCIYFNNQEGEQMASNEEQAFQDGHNQVEESSQKELMGRMEAQLKELNALFQKARGTLVHNQERPAREQAYEFQQTHYREHEPVPMNPYQGVPYSRSEKQVYTQASPYYRTTGYGDPSHRSDFHEDPSRLYNRRAWGSETSVRSGIQMPIKIPTFTGKEDWQGKDLCELRRHTYANTVDYRTLKKLVQKVFPSCRCLDVYKRHADAVKEAGNFQDDDFDIYSEEPKEGVRERVCPGHERSLPIEQTVMELDVKEEGLSTLLCYLELHDSQWLENLPNVYHNCKIQCYGGPGQLQAVAKKCPPVAVAVAKARSQGKTFNNTNTVEFAVVEISDMMGWDSGPVKKELKLLQWNFNEAGLAPSRSGILVELTDLAFHFRSPGDFNLEELDDILQFLHNRVKRQEKQELCSLAKLHNTLKSVSHKNYWMCADSIDNAKNEKLKAVLNEYFDSQNMEAGHDSLVEEDKQVSDVTLGQVISDVRHFHGLYGQEHTLNGRAIARIFHGIASPCYPATTWGRVRRFWRCHLDVDFNQVVKLATKELISMRQ